MTYDITEGKDGRRLCRLAQPFFWTDGVVPQITHGRVREIINEFNRVGHTSHSGRRHCLGYIIEYCERNLIPYKLTARPGVGYYIEKDDQA